MGRTEVHSTNEFRRNSATCTSDDKQTWNISRLVWACIAVVVLAAAPSKANAAEPSARPKASPGDAAKSTAIPDAILGVLQNAGDNFRSKTTGKVNSVDPVEEFPCFEIVGVRDHTQISVTTEIEKTLRTSKITHTAEASVSYTVSFAGCKPNWVEAKEGRVIIWMPRAKPADESVRRFSAVIDESSGLYDTLCYSKDDVVRESIDKRDELVANEMRRRRNDKGNIDRATRSAERQLKALVEAIIQKHDPKSTIVVEVKTWDPSR